jgi:hypothetical protein
MYKEFSQIKQEDNLTENHKKHKVHTIEDKPKLITIT